ncbi:MULTISPECIES: site-specific integrase [unclassified Rhodococcus (in: high G+C Gram-positive bacteria)]|uniref:tyrosine-type recombinase/integrase n=1 Tax=unclassified Rhodococcus (in: high G+C Gram-positive bacteria) TaxID=192944 RepID=UPI0020CC30A0|nr:MULTISPECIES: site-specific integrase [unclassified Rhodococcus (in: high G+C Gram-positive bacteria)]
MAKSAGKRSFGSLRKLPSGRWQARYTGPDTREYKASSTFAAKIDAEAWLTDRRREIDRELWSPPTDAVTSKAKPVSFREYAETWLEQRDLKPRSREHYRKLLDVQVLPGLGSLPLASITPDDVRAWHAKLDAATPTLRSHAYGLVRTILATAANDGKITNNPAHIRGAGSAKRVHKIRPATLPELATITEEMPKQWAAMILFASWLAMRFGEITELRRGDVDLTDEVIRIRRAVVRVDGQFVVGDPKSEAGTRDVAIPPHLVPAIESHLKDHVGPGKDALLFPAVNGGHLQPSTLYRRYYAARAKAGRDDLRFHDLRHSGAVLAAATGASLAELMGRLGHSTPAAALRYQHVAGGRDKAIAAALSALVSPNK